MKKEKAIEILKTNIHRKMMKKLGIYQLPMISVILGSHILLSVFSSIQWPEIDLPSFPPSPLESVNVIPPIFAGSLTAISVIIGFFSVSIHRFHQKCEDFFDALQKEKRESAKEKRKVIHRIEQELARAESEAGKDKEAKKEIESMKRMLDETNKNYQEYEELTQLNIDAMAHIQEHSGSFMTSYLLISYLIFMIHITSFLATIVTSVFIDVFLQLNLLSISIVFTGLAVFLEETSFYHGHQELINNQ